MFCFVFIYTDIELELLKLFFSLFRIKRLIFAYLIRPLLGS